MHADFAAWPVGNLSWPEKKKIVKSPSTKHACERESFLHMIIVIIIIIIIISSSSSSSRVTCTMSRHLLV